MQISPPTQPFFCPKPQSKTPNSSSGLPVEAQITIFQNHNSIPCCKGDERIKVLHNASSQEALCRTSSGDVTFSHELGLNFIYL